MMQYYLGTTVRVRLEVRDEDTDLYDPDSVTVTILGPAGVALETGAASPAGVGKYYYDYQSAVSGPEGVYTVVAEAVDGVHKGRVAPRLFRLR